jgi:hypothetical protein|tara:strand:+ start:4428 stop:4628 length:201 start_codon:yes stop_codon:yes gene_type:complete
MGNMPQNKGLPSTSLVEVSDEEYDFNVKNKLPNTETAKQKRKINKNLRRMAFTSMLTRLIASQRKK